MHFLQVNLLQIVLVFTVIKGFILADERGSKENYFDLTTNLEYQPISDHHHYVIYKLKVRPNPTQSQTNRVNLLLDQYLRESFETPERAYIYLLEYCGATILAAFARNTSLSLENLAGLLLANLGVYDNSQYVCYISVLKEHRQQGLGTKLLYEMINEAVQTKNSRLTLHVNTANQNAITLYRNCGMRCVDFISGYYLGDQTYPTHDAFVMLLEIKNVRNITIVCQSSLAVEISVEEDALYRQRCPQVLLG